jgi:predicted outer membrane repeat protein
VIEWEDVIMRIVLAAVCSVLALCQGAGATTIVVDVNGGPGSDYVTIGEGLLAASDHDTVLVMPGTYLGAQNRDMDPLGREVVIKASGPVDGTIIDCGGVGRAFDIHSGEGHSLVIEGFTIMGGFADGPGGGISVQSSSPTIEHCVFQECESNDSGGAIYLESSSARIRWVWFEANAATYGGALTAESSGATIADCAFLGNAAESGGAVYSADDDASTFDESAYFHNEASDWGGAFCATWGASPAVTNSVFFENGATGLGGGAISCHEYGTNATITGNTIVRNGGVGADGASFFDADALPRGQQLVGPPLGNL